MNIAFFYRTLRHGGVEKTLVNLANYFVRNGHNVTLILIKEEGDYLDLLSQGIRVVALENSGRRTLYSSFVSILKKENFNVIFTAGVLLNIVTIVARMLSRVKTKVVISEHSNTLAFFKQAPASLTKFSFLLIPVFYRFADAVVAVSNGVAEGLKSFALMSKDKITCIHNPIIDDQIFEDAVLEVEDDWIGKTDFPLLVSVGRLVEAKNFALLIDAVKLLNEHRLIKLIIIGDGPLQMNLQKKIDLLQMNHIVRLVGYKAKPISWINKADLFVLSSNREGFGNVLVEALAAGTNIVSIDCKSGPAEILNNGEFGFLVTSENSMALASGIEYALSHPIEKQILIKRSMDFKIKKIGSEYERLFLRLSKIDNAGY